MKRITKTTLLLVFVFAFTACQEEVIPTTTEVIYDEPQFIENFQLETDVEPKDTVAYIR